MTEYDGVERSTATETLRAMLDERGVEWEDGGEGLTIIPVQDGVPRAWTVNTWPSGKDMGDCLWVQNRHPLTPEQAIAATLGVSDATQTRQRDAGTCKPTTYDNGYSTDHLEPGEYHEFWEPACACGNCGELIPMRKFCPNCGRRLEVDDG